MFLEQQIRVISKKKHLKSYQSQTLEWIYIMWIGLSSLNPKNKYIQIKTFPKKKKSVLS